jgi:hypothetical protein
MWVNPNEIEGEQRKKMRGIKKIRTVLKKYNYWRGIFGLSFRKRRKPILSSECQVACHSDPCDAPPTCDFD